MPHIMTAFSLWLPNTFTPYLLPHLPLYKSSPSTQNPKYLSFSSISFLCPFSYTSQITQSSHVLSSCSTCILSSYCQYLNISSLFHFIIPFPIFFLSQPQPCAHFPFPNSQYPRVVYSMLRQSEDEPEDVLGEILINIGLAAPGDARPLTPSTSSTSSRCSPAPAEPEVVAIVIEVVVIVAQ